MALQCSPTLPIRQHRQRRQRKEGKHRETLEIAMAVFSAVAIILAQYLHAGGLRPALAFPAYGALLIAGGLCAVKALAGHSRKRKLTPLLPGVALLFWLGWHCLNAGDAGAGSASFRLACGGMLLFIILAHGITTARARLLFFALLFASGLAQGLLSAWQHQGLLGISPQGWFSEQLREWFAGRSNARVTGLYLNSNHFAWFLNAMGLYALALLFWGRLHTGWRIVVGGAAIAFFTCSLFTLSRGGLLALAGGYSIFLALSAYTLLRRGQLRSQKWRLGGVILCTLPLLLLTTLPKRVDAEGDFSRFNGLFRDAYRSELWPLATQYIEEAPLVGNGPGAFTYYARQHRESGHRSDDLYAHNDWLQITGDYGMIGLGLALLLLTTLIAGGVRHLGRVRRAMVQSAALTSNRAAIAIGSLAAVVAFAIHSTFDFNLQLPANALLAVACAACLCRPASQEAAKCWHLPGLCLLLCTTLACSLYHNRSELAWLRGENAALRGDYLAACRIAKEALPHGAFNARLAYLLGDITLLRARLKESPEGMLIQLAEAERALRQAATLLPRERLHHLRLAETLLYRSRAAEGRAAALRGVALAPHQALGYELCGWSYELEEQFERAIECYQQAARLPDHRIARKRLAYLQSREK